MILMPSQTKSRLARSALRRLHDIYTGIRGRVQCLGVREYNKHCIVRISGTGLSVPRLGSNIDLHEEFHGICLGLRNGS